MDFQSPLPLRRADDILVTQLRHRRISIHAPRGGSDERGIQIGGHAQHFNPRSPRGERLGVLSADRTAIAISIHAPRGGSDFFRVRSGYKYRLFQSTLPAGGATLKGASGLKPVAFQSTLPAGGATSCKPKSNRCIRHFNPRSPRGERRINALRYSQPNLFQSTLPAGGATTIKVYVPRDKKISIHAPRGGSDRGGSGGFSGAIRDFNPRSPRGERPGRHPEEGARPVEFQSTLPAGGATQESIRNPGRYRHFNPRSPRGERPCLFIHRRYQEMLFQSTLPAGGATRLKLCEEASDCISIHAPRGGSDLPFRAYCLIWNISIHAPRGGSD